MTEEIEKQKRLEAVYRGNIQRHIEKSNLPQGRLSMFVFGDTATLHRLMEGAHYTPTLKEVMRMSYHFSAPVSEFMPFYVPYVQVAVNETPKDAQRYLRYHLSARGMSYNDVALAAKGLGSKGVTEKAVENFVNADRQSFYEQSIYFIHRLSVVLNISTASLIPTEMPPGSRKTARSVIPEGFVPLTPENIPALVTVKYEMNYGRFHLSKPLLEVTGFKADDLVTVLYNAEKRQILLTRGSKTGSRLDSRHYLRNTAMADVLRELGIERRAVFTYNTGDSNESHHVLDLRGEA